MLSSYSFSSLDTYRVCPRKFKYAYVDRVPIPPKVTADTYLGNAVHRVLRKLYTLGADGILMPMDRAIEAYLEEWQKLDRNSITSPSDYYTIDDYIRIGKEMLVRHYEHYQPFDQGTLLGAEMHLTFQLPGTPFKFKSYIDRLWKKDDGTVEICDYKTGQSTILPHDRRFVYQMGLYQLAVQANFPQYESVDLAQYLLRKDEIVSHRLRPDELDMLAEQLRLDVNDTIESTRKDDFPAQEGSHCTYCSYHHLCPAKIHRRMLEEEEQSGDTGEISALQLKELADEYLRVYSDSKRIDAELDGIKEKLLNIARDHDLSRFDGDSGKVTVSVSRKDEFISKTRDQKAFAQLSALCRKLQLDEYFSLDARGLMKEVYQKKRLPDDILNQLKEFVVEVERSRVTAKLNAETDPAGEESSNDS
ncbi:MAG: PD-(D/E)XK nuclease family protein [Candidatus Zixiibacteriota bacterium]|nr:MAG: PD-(D/E)XK nuclease family protein [candidate division Zixibacteria bacterium]